MKILFLIISILLITSAIFAQTPPEDLLKARDILNAGYVNLRENSKRVDSVLLTTELPAIETILALKAKSDIKLAAESSIGILRMYNMQSACDSTPKKVQAILREHCYNVMDTLNYAENDLKSVLEQINNIDIKTIILSSTEFIRNNRQAVQTIQRYEQQGIFIKD